jgi:large subunit ribosomal protein L3
MHGIWGKKIGMTQLFTESNKVVPVTVIDASNWCIVQVKNKDRDGYDAVKIGLVREGFEHDSFSKEWLKEPRKYFAVLREVAIKNDQHEFAEGQKTDLAVILDKGEHVDVVGTTIGKGFTGVMKRHGFHGGRGSHGDKLGRGPGSLSFMRRQGRVVKGKKMPGHCGADRCTIKNVEVIKVEPASHVIFVKGAVPGKTGSLVFLRKHG